LAEYGIQATQLSAPTGAGSAPVGAVETPGSHILDVITTVADVFSKNMAATRKEEAAKREEAIVSGRTVTRPMLEAAKARYVNQHKAVLPNNEFGGKSFPQHIETISSKGDVTSKQIRDARSDYEYINYLENAYINSMDEVFKQAFNAMASGTGAVIKKVSPGATQKGLAAVERGLLQASEVSVSGTAKGTVFTATIVSNVLRQWIMQPHQVLRTVAYNPIGWANGAVPELVAGYLGMGMGLKPFTKGIQKEAGSIRLLNICKNIL